MSTGIDWPENTALKGRGMLNGYRSIAKTVWPPETLEDALKTLDFPDFENQGALHANKTGAPTDAYSQLVKKAFPETLREPQVWIEDIPDKRSKSNGSALRDLFSFNTEDLRNSDFAKLVLNLAYVDLDIGHRHRNISDAVQGIENEISRRSSMYNSDIANIYLGLSGLDPRVVSESLMNKLGVHLKRFASACSANGGQRMLITPDLVKIFYGLRNLNTFETDCKVVTEANTWEPLKRILKDHPDLNLNKSSNFLRIFQGLQSYKADDFGSELLNAIVLRIPKDMILRGDDLTQGLFSFNMKKPEDFSKEALERLEHIVINSFENNLDYEFRPSNIYQILYGLQQFNETRLYKYFTTKLRESLKTNPVMEDVTALNLTQALRYAQYHYAQTNPKANETAKHLRVPRELQEQASKFQEENSCDYASGPEYVAHSTFHQDYPDSRDSLQPNTFLCGFEVDFFDKSRNIVFEIDGPDHIGPKVAKDRQRDNVLKYLYKRKTGKDLEIYRIDAKSYNDEWLPSLEAIAGQIYTRSV